MENVISFMTAKDAALKWNISQRRVSTLCNENRIQGAALLGNMWIIPINSEKPADKRIKYTNSAKPFVKWAGGKSQLVEEISKRFPDEFGKSIKKYAEPFVGGGALLFYILCKYQLDEIFISDSNVDLINVYNVIKYDADQLIKQLEQMQNEYINLSDTQRRNYYFSVRDEYNDKASSDSTLRAARFIFLNKTCFNGLYRVNRKGQFNVPIGSYKNPKICDKDNLIAVSNALKNVKIMCCDYHEIENFVDENTLVYFDPPYRPLSKTSAFTSYNETDFNDEDQKQLAEYIKHLASKGAKVLASNSDPKNTNPDDDFFDELYKPLNISRVTAKRSINSKGNNRGNISELLICNY